MNLPVFNVGLVIIVFFFSHLNFRPDLWQFEVSRDLPGCKPFHPPGVNASTTCLFYFSLCKPVPDLCPTNSGICLTNKIDYGPKYKKIVYTKPENIGSFIAGPEAFKSGAVLQCNIESV